MLDYILKFHALNLPPRTSPHCQFGLHSIFLFASFFLHVFSTLKSSSLEKMAIIIFNNIQLTTTRHTSHWPVSYHKGSCYSLSQTSTLGYMAMCYWVNVIRLGLWSILYIRTHNFEIENPFDWVKLQRKTSNFVEVEKNSTTFGVTCSIWTNSITKVDDIGFSRLASRQLNSSLSICVFTPTFMIVGVHL